MTIYIVANHVEDAAGPIGTLYVGWFETREEADRAAKGKFNHVVYEVPKGTACTEPE